MKTTNIHNLPERVTRMLPEKYKPDPNRMGVTQLIDAPLIRTLMIEKWDEIEYDISDMLSTLIGISVHDRAEKFATEDEEAEQKLEFTKDSKGDEFGLTLVMKADNVFQSEIRDTKTKAVGFKNFGLQKEIEQMNCYAWGQRMSFNEIDKLVLDVYYRDWKLSKATYDKDYPEIAYEEIELPLWTFEQQEEFIWSRLQLHKDQPMFCSNTDKWKKEDSFAVMVGNRKRAERVLASIGEAQKWIKENGRGDRIDIRKGDCIRCSNYCNVRSVCPTSDKCQAKFKAKFKGERHEY